jgi:hypothetical protein
MGVPLLPPLLGTGMVISESRRGLPSQSLTAQAGAGLEGGSRRYLVSFDQEKPSMVVSWDMTVS